MRFRLPFLLRQCAQDHAQAALWYRKAADQGMARAQFVLGAMYYSGNGVKKIIQKHLSGLLELQKMVILTQKKY